MLSKFVAAKFYRASWALHRNRSTAIPSVIDNSGSSKTFFTFITNNRFIRIKVFRL